MSSITPPPGIRRSTWHRDIDGTEIFEGDEVLTFVLEYPSKLVENGVYEITSDTPYPLKDIPLSRGVVVWDTEYLGFAVQVIEDSPSWAESGIASRRMDTHGYAYQVIHKP